MKTSVEIQIQDSSQIGEARRMSAQYSESAELSDVDSASFAIIVSELATNILKHAKTGSLILSYDDRGVEVLALDKGPGIANMSQAFQDGFSTAGTAGNGLGAVRRMATVSDFYSASGLGFMAYARMEKEANNSRNYRLAGFNVPYPGETASGDALAYQEKDNVLSLAVIDGLGHGLLAAEAAKIGINGFKQSAFVPPRTQLENLHKALRSTRGAAMSIAQIHFESRTIQHCGIGNVVMTEVGIEKNKRMISYDGTLGLQVRRFQELTYPFSPQSLLIMHSDGISTNWDLSKYPGLKRQHPALIAGALLRDFRKKDDSTVAVVQTLGAS